MCVLFPKDGPIVRTSWVNHEYKASLSNQWCVAGLDTIKHSVAGQCWLTHALSVDEFVLHYLDRPRAATPKSRKRLPWICPGDTLAYQHGVARHVEQDVALLGAHNRA